MMGLPGLIFPFHFGLGQSKLAINGGTDGPGERFRRDVAGEMNPKNHRYTRMLLYPRVTRRSISGVSNTAILSDMPGETAVTPASDAFSLPEIFCRLVYPEFS